MGNFIDLTGQRFGRWTVISRVGSDSNKRAAWLCKCDCGRTKVVNSSNLIQGTSKCCGCTRKDSLEQFYSKNYPAHGLYGTRLYTVYANILYRTENPSSPDYHNYGGRGIKICCEWRDSFKAFYDWSLMNGYKEGLTIDRIDVNKGYSPGNCRWVDRLVQANNTRMNCVIECFGERHTLAEWARIVGISRLAIYKRIQRGWSIERALTEPLHKNK